MDEVRENKELINDVTEVEEERTIFDDICYVQEQLRNPKITVEQLKAYGDLLAKLRKVQADEAFNYESLEAQKEESEKQREAQAEEAERQRAFQMEESERQRVFQEIENKKARDNQLWGFTIGGVFTLAGIIGGSLIKGTVERKYLKDYVTYETNDNVLINTKKVRMPKD